MVHSFLNITFVCHWVVVKVTAYFDAGSLFFVHIVVRNIVSNSTKKSYIFLHLILAPVLAPVCRTQELYLPHKTYKKDHPVKGRPIIFANNGPTEHIPQFVNHFLKPPTIELPPFVNYTIHFLKIL